MATDSQCNANRENAQHSTGPKTPEGKHRSSLNATKFGLTGRTVLLPSDDLEAYDTFLQKWTDELKPVGIRELEYLRTIVDCKWRLNRIRSAEDGIFALGIQAFGSKIDTGQALTDSVITSALTADSQAKALDNISRYEARISREFSKAMHSLEALQAERKAAGQAAREESIRIFKLHKMLEKPFDPKEFGFEMSGPEIAQAAARADLLQHAGIAHATGYNREKFLKATA